MIGHAKSVFIRQNKLVMRFLPLFLVASTLSLDPNSPVDYALEPHFHGSQSAPSTSLLVVKLDSVPKGNKSIKKLPYLKETM